MAEGVVSGLEAAHDEMVNWALEQARQLKEAIGPRPLFSEKIPERVQTRQGAIMYDDPAAWEALLRQNGWQGPGSPVPKNVLEYGQRLTRLSQKYPDEWSFGQSATSVQAAGQEGAGDGE